MASAVSYELYESQKGVPNGIATLNANGVLEANQIPPIAQNNYKGEFATSAALIAAFPTGMTEDYAYVTATSSLWYWNSGLVVPAWVNQEINVANYTALTAQAKARVQYVLVP